MSLKGSNKKEYQRNYMRERRKKNSVTQTPENVTRSPESVTTHQDNVTLDVTQYPAILYALVDPIKRRKLERVYQSLKEFKQEKNVFYGYPNLIPFDVVGEYLEVTK